MIWWLVLIGLNVGLVGGATLARRSPRPRRALRRLLAFSLLFLILTPLVGIAFGLVSAFAAVGGEAVDPSQKARLLGQGIAEAMNLTAFGILGFFVPSVVALVLFLRAPKEPIPPSASGAV